jgi:ribosomal protein L11 methylase PrmA
MFSFTHDTILDPFCGTGTSLLAAMKTGRNSIGIEIDPTYAKMAFDRLNCEQNSLFQTQEIILNKPYGKTTSPENRIPIVAEKAKIANCGREKRKLNPNFKSETKEEPRS